MRWKNLTLICATGLLATSAWAHDSNSNCSNCSTHSSSDTMSSDETSSADEDMDMDMGMDMGMKNKEQAGRTEDTAGTTMGREEKRGGAVRQEGFGIKPQLGAMVFTNPVNRDETETRGAIGLLFDINAAGLALGDTPSNWFIGPQIGAIYSHIGAPGAGFFGTQNGGGGGNVLLLPANLKLGWNPLDALRVGVHGGGNVIYRSQANIMNLGSDSARSESLWKIYPNVGADLEFSLGQSATLMLRPDFTLAPNNDIFTGTVGISASLG